MNVITIPKFEIKDEYLKYLKEIQSNEKKLFERAIFDHYEGCYNLLKSWEYEDKICTFGLFHSVYERHIFQHNKPNEQNRKKLSALIGNEVEELIFKWDSMDRRSYINDLIDYPEKQIKNDPFVIMIWANIFEQAISNNKPTSGKEIFSKTIHLVDKKPAETFSKLVDEGLII